MKKYFLDSNVIIDFFNRKESAIQKIEVLLAEENCILYYSKLVYVECLRTITDKDKFTKSEKFFNNIESIDINPEIYKKSIQLSQYCQIKGTNIKGKCPIIDYINFSCAKYYKLEILSNDKDFSVLEKCYNELDQ